MGRKETQVVCKSVFKGGENATTADRYTKKWIELINRLEKDKKASPVKR